jgi:putative SOS response-associated peptidase YedK
MCYNLAFLTKRLEKYAERYKDTLPPGFLSTVDSGKTLPEYYFLSGFDYPELPVVTGNDILMCRWGLIPSWTRDQTTAADIRSKTHNAVGETIFEKPSFRNSITSRRCILGINGFYEWRLFNKSKYPYFITSAENEIFSLGCIYDSWTDKSTGQVHHTFSVITTPANPLMETIHNTKKRMPLILNRDEEKAWVSPSLSSGEIRDLIKPCPDTVLKAITVSKNINYARSDRNIPGSMTRVVYPELEFGQNTLFS